MESIKFTRPKADCSTSGVAPPVKKLRGFELVVTKSDGRFKPCLLKASTEPRFSPAPVSPTNSKNPECESATAEVARIATAAATVAVPEGPLDVPFGAAEQYLHVSKAMNHPSYTCLWHDRCMDS